MFLDTWMPRKQHLHLHVSDQELRMLSRISRRLSQLALCDPLLLQNRFVVGLFSFRHMPSWLSLQAPAAVPLFPSLHSKEVCRPRYYRPGQL